MKPPPRLRLEPRPSRTAAIVLACGSIATALLIFTSMPDVLVRTVLVVAVGALGVRWIRKLRRTPLLLHVGVDRRISVTVRNGRTHHGTIHADTSVGAWITTIVWVPDGARWLMPARTLMILPDMLPADDFRRLRVYLRHGRTSGDPDTSGVAAG